MRKTLLTALLLMAVATAAPAASPGDPEWPCQRRKVPTLTPGLMWSGPQISDQIRQFEEDRALHDLAARLALRRIPLSEAETMIADYAAGLGPDRNPKLTAVFYSTFALINHERGAIISGITRYAKKQTALSTAIETKRAQIRALSAAANPDLDKLEELQDTLTWDERIFKERSQSLRYVCETPVILEKRIFAIARALQSHMQ